ncbi:MAG: hypothetical protein U0793_02705 [Gemmataceae bacterium]
MNLHRLWLIPALLSGVAPLAAQEGLRAGFGAVDITPTLTAKKPVYLAGFGHNRKATGVHDPIMARAVVLDDGKNKLALVSVDVVGLFLPEVERVRAKLPGFAHVLVSSTHNHEGPDTLGLWGPNPFQSGVDPDYLEQVRASIVRAVEQADKKRAAVQPRIGTATGPELLHDGRKPIVKHDELVAILLTDAKGKNAGLIVQWNCHPETLSDKNTLLSADFTSATVDHLQKKHDCPVVYLTGTVGGLMTSLHVPIKDDAGKDLADGTFEKTREYGVRVGRLADAALAKAGPVRMTPLEVRRRDVFLPLDNPLYVVGWKLGVLKREAFLWTGNSDRAEKAPDTLPKMARLAIRSELAWLRLGEVQVAAIPGEIYPELVLGKVQDPPDPGADFPDAAIEPAIYDQLAAKH